VDWSAKVELYEQLRREYEFGIGSIRGVARKFGVRRRMVREAARQALPPPRKVPVRGRPRLDPLRPFSDAILDADRTAPRKQRHTAHRIFVRLRQEQPAFPIAESTVREYVRERKHALGLAGKVTCVPQAYAFGSEGQADWDEAVAELGGVRQTLQVFGLRSMASGGAFHRALHPCHPASVPRSPRAGLRLLWRRLPPGPLRQLAARGEADPPRPRARPDRALHRLPLPLALHQRVLHARGGTREGRDRRGGRGPSAGTTGSLSPRSRISPP
jgi:hypothetical protein